MTRADIELMHDRETKALHDAEHDHLVKVTLSGHRSRVRYELGHAMVRLGRWLEGKPMDHFAELEQDRHN
jgi:hypothetical protein